MNPTPETPESEPHSCCSGEGCQTPADQRRKFGKRGAVIAGSLGLTLAACNTGVLRDPGRGTVLYGPPPMPKSAGETQGKDGMAKPVDTKADGAKPDKAQ